MSKIQKALDNMSDDVILNKPELNIIDNLTKKFEEFTKLYINSIGNIYIVCDYSESKKNCCNYWLILYFVKYIQVNYNDISIELLNPTKINQNFLSNIKNNDKFLFIEEIVNEHTINTFENILEKILENMVNDDKFIFIGLIYHTIEERYYNDYFIIIKNKLFKYLFEKIIGEKINDKIPNYDDSDLNNINIIIEYFLREYQKQELLREQEEEQEVKQSKRRRTNNYVHINFYPKLIIEEQKIREPDGINVLDKKLLEELKKLKKQLEKEKSVELKQKLKISNLKRKIENMNIDEFQKKEIKRNKKTTGTTSSYFYKNMESSSYKDPVTNDDY